MKLAFPVRVCYDTEKMIKNKQGLPVGRRIPMKKKIRITVLFVGVAALSVFLILVLSGGMMRGFTRLASPEAKQILREKGGSLWVGRPDAVEIVDLGSGDKTVFLPQGYQRPASLAVGKDGRVWCAAADTENRPCLLCASGDGTVLASAPVHCIGLTPFREGVAAAVAQEAGGGIELRLYDETLAGYQTVCAALAAPEGFASSVRLLADDTHLVYLRMNDSLPAQPAWFVYDWAAKTERSLGLSESHTCAALLPDGDLLTYDRSQNTFCVVSLETGQTLRAYETPLSDGRRQHNDLPMAALSPDGSCVLCMVQEGGEPMTGEYKLVVFSLEDGQPHSISNFYTSYPFPTPFGEIGFFCWDS